MAHIHEGTVYFEHEGGSEAYLRSDVSRLRSTTRLQIGREEILMSAHQALIAVRMQVLVTTAVQWIVKSFHPYGRRFCVSSAGIE